MFINFNKNIKLNQIITPKGIKHTFMISSTGLPYIKYKDIQLLLMHTKYSDKVDKFTYAHISFNCYELKQEYSTTYFMFPLGSEIQIPKHITSKLSKDEKGFLTQIRNFVRNYEDTV